MILEYNRVKLQVEQVTSFEQTPIYSADGVDYLYTHVRINVRAIWHPNATNFQGKVAAESIETLRRTLLTPRRDLSIKVPSGGLGSYKAIIDVARGLAEKGADANNGPKPIGMPVIQIIGEKLAVVDFAVETWVVECDSVRKLLSHRWEMSQARDAEFFTTRTTTGTAVLHALNVPIPDSYRLALMPPVPTGFRRISEVTTPSSDGTTMNYTVVDEQITGNIAADYGRIARYEGTAITTYGVDLNPREMITRGLEGARGTETGIMGFIAGFLSAASRGLPTTTDGIQFRLWGTPQATNIDLVKAAAAILIQNNFLPNFQDGRPMLRIILDVTEFLVGLINVKYTMAVSMGPRPMIEVSAFRTYPDPATGAGTVIRRLIAADTATMFPVVALGAIPAAQPLNSSVQTPGVPCTTPLPPTNLPAVFTNGA